MDGNTHKGEMIVNYHIAEDVLDILKTLYEADYPIERIRLVDDPRNKKCYRGIKKEVEIWEKRRQKQRI